MSSIWTLNCEVISAGHELFSGSRRCSLQEITNVSWPRHCITCRLDYSLLIEAALDGQLPMSSSITMRYWLKVVALTFGAAAGIRAQASPARTADQAQLPAPYVGSRACQSCHTD